MTPDRRWGTIGYFAAFAALGLVTGSLGPTLPGLAAHTRTQLSEISLLFTAHALGYLLGSFLGGRFYDRVAGHAVMAAMLLLTAAMLGLAPLLGALWLLSAAWLVLGMAGGAVDVGGNTLLVWVHGRQVGPFMNGLHFFFGAGSFLAPIVVAQAMRLSGDITWAYWILALLVLPVAAGMLRLPSPAPPHASPDEPSPERGSPDRSGSPPERSRRLFVALIALLLLLYVGAEASFGGWIYTYAVALDLADGTTAAYLTSAFWGALTVGRLLAIPLAARFRPSAILLVDLVGCLASVGVLLLWPHAPAAAWLGTLGLGLAMASIFPTAISLAERRVPITGQVTGWFLVGASVGAMVLPWSIGQLFEAHGPRITMALILIDLLAATAVFAALARPKASSRQQKTLDTGAEI